MKRHFTEDLLTFCLDSSFPYYSLLTVIQVRFHYFLNLHYFAVWPQILTPFVASTFKSLISVEASLVTSSDSIVPFKTFAFMFVASATSAYVSVACTCCSASAGGALASDSRLGFIRIV